MQVIGKIDRRIYQVVAPDITTEEVIITEKQIQHIQERHPKDYEQYAQFIRLSVEQPDYIIECDAPATAFILKSFETGGKGFRTILRLHTASDECGKKNSVITFQHVKEKEYKRLLRNKKILYKRCES